MPCLGGNSSEHWPLAGGSLVWQQAGGWHMGVAGDLLWLCALADAQDATLEAATHDLYRELFTLLRDGWRLQRIWHYLPRINEPGADGLERYRAFCRGRSVAFEAAFGSKFHLHLPAASAVGCEGSALVVYACARRNAAVRYYENPLQVPAYRYSQVYGPRAPGFARASLTEYGAPAALADAEPQVAPAAPMASAHTEPSVSSAAPARVESLGEVYFSGTASIRNEDSLTAGGILGQLAITVENLNRIAAECGLEHFLVSANAAAEGSAGNAAPKPVTGVPSQRGGPVRSSRRFKVYLRRAEDYPLVSEALNALLQPDDAVIYLRSDICRAELDLEIEASVTLRGC